MTEGTPEDVAREPRSYTGQYLAALLAKPVRAHQVPALKLSKARARNPKCEREAAE